MLLMHLDAYAFKCLFVFVLKKHLFDRKAWAVEVNNVPVSCWVVDFIGAHYRRKK